MSVYQNIIDGEEYALKEIDMRNQSKQKHHNAKNEISFLKVLKSPTIIKFVDSFEEANKIYIVMEYASNGNL